MTGGCALCRSASTALVPTALLPVKVLADLHGPRDEDPFRFTSYGTSLIESLAPTTSRSSPRLCAACRQLHASWEDRFARDILRRSEEDAGPRAVLVYGDWLPRLAASLAWRALTSLTTRAHTFAESGLRDRTIEAIDVWRAVAAGQRLTTGGFDLHMLPIPRIAEESDRRWYAREVVHLRPMVARTGDAWVWMKLPGVLLIGAIQPHGDGPFTNSRLEIPGASRWGDTQVHVPGIVRFLMFEELRRTLLEWRSLASEASLSECQG